MSPFLLVTWPIPLKFLVDCKSNRSERLFLTQRHARCHGSTSEYDLRHFFFIYSPRFAAYTGDVVPVSCESAEHPRQTLHSIFVAHTYVHTHYFTKLHTYTYHTGRSCLLKASVLRSDARLAKKIVPRTL